MASQISTRTFRKLTATTFSTDFRKACEIVTAKISSLDEGEVLVKSRFAGVNATDINFSAGKYSPGRGPPLDVGLEGVGVIEEIGKNVPEKVLGKSFGYIWYGSFAEYLKIPFKALLPVPTADASYIPFLISGLTAGISLDQFGGLSPGSVALITAAAGGTGHIAVQLAKQKGCHVIALCSNQEKAEFLKGIGADRVINTSEESLSDVLSQEYKRGIDLAYESIGGNIFQTCVDSLAVKGRIISLGYISSYHSPGGVDRGSRNATLTQKLLSKSACVSGFFLFNHRKDYDPYFQRLTTMYQNSQLRPHVEQCNTAGQQFVGLESVYDAVEYLYSRKSCGKIVVDIHPDLSKL